MTATVDPPATVLLSAFGIHTGGGLVLLNSLVHNMGGALKAVALDDRFLNNSRFVSPENLRVERVRRSFPARFAALRNLVNMAAEGDLLFCFNSLPPLRKPKGRVVIFVQAPHFVGVNKGFSYSKLTTIRHWIECTWFRYGISNCDEIWVQTRSMADALAARYPNALIRIVPFIDDELAALFAKQSLDVCQPVLTSNQFSFFYPADAVGHKNHANLLKAWELLKDEGKSPTLLLTLHAEELVEVSKSVIAFDAARCNVLNLGRLNRAEVLKQLQNCSALIFPSQAETFGLPMLEARALDVPVLAAERDFVRDVCLPIQTFDPNSPRSIAMAVSRFMEGSVTPPAEYFSAAQFVTKLLSSGVTITK